jgi:hypothetical protein
MLKCFHYAKPPNLPNNRQAPVGRLGDFDARRKSIFEFVNVRDDQHQINNILHRGDGKLESRFECLPTLPKWFVRIAPSAFAAWRFILLD